MKIKAKKLIEILQGIKSVGSLTEPSGKFSYAMSKNRKIVEAEIATLQDTKKPNEDYKLFEEDKRKLMEGLAKKDEKGNVIQKIIDKFGTYTFEFDNEEDVKNKLNELSLSKKYKTIVEEQNAKEKSFMNLLDSDIKIDLFLIDNECIPTNITPDQRFSIIELIKE